MDLQPKGQDACAIYLVGPHSFFLFDGRLLWPTLYWCGKEVTKAAGGCHWCEKGCVASPPPRTAGVAGGGLAPPVCPRAGAHLPSLALALAQEKPCRTSRRPTRPRRSARPNIGPTRRYWHHTPCARRSRAQEPAGAREICRGPVLGARARAPPRPARPPTHDAMRLDERVRAGAGWQTRDD